MKITPKTRLISAMSALALAAGAAPAANLFVDATAPPGGAGGSWATAFNDLQSALTLATSGDIVWVAAGTYRPGVATSASFTIPEGVHILGGYAGFGAPAPDDWDPEANPTILTGDLNGDDAPGFANRADNARHVVTINSGDGVVLDGLLIAGGHTTGVGGGVVIGAGSPTISHCTLASNDASFGGAIYASAGLTATDTLFEDNMASSGGGAIYRPGSAPDFTINGCEFRANSAGEGGAILFFNTAPGPFITNSTFYGNTSSSYSGGIGNLAAGMTLSGCILSGNSALASGGALTTSAGAPTIDHCTIADNTAGTGGGVCLTSSASEPVVTFSILWENSDSTGLTEAAQISDADGPPHVPSVSDSCVMGDPVYPGSGNINADPLFQDPPTDYALRPGSPCISAGMGAVASQNALPQPAAVCQQLTSIGQTARVSLDGTGTTDEEDSFDALTFQWLVDGSPVAGGPAADFAAIEVSLGYGTHDVTLIVTDTGDASAQVTKQITVNAAALSLLEAGKTVADFKAGGPGKGSITIVGEVGLPYGVNFTEVARTAAVNVSVAGASVGAAALTLALDHDGWIFSDPNGVGGLTHVDIDWKGGKFEYKANGLTLRSDVITTSETILTVKFNMKKIGGPFALTIDGRANLSVSATGVATADVPFSDDDHGKEVTLHLPFAITADTLIAIAGPPYALIDAGDYLTASIGRYRIEGKFNSAAFPDGAATTPRTVDLSLTLGNEGYSGAATVGSADLAVKKDKWQAH